MIRSLYLSHIQPFPPFGGEKMRSLGLIHLLAEAGEVAVVTQSSDANLKASCWIPEKAKLFPFDFTQAMKPVVRYWLETPALSRHLEGVLREFKPELVLIDYQYYGNYINWFHKRGLPVIYGTHNVESEITRQEIKTLPWLKRCKQRALYQQHQWHEKIYFKQADRFITVAEPDTRHYQQWVAAEKIVMIPNFLVPSWYPRLALEIPRQVDRVVITANFNAYQNREGMAWFLEQVWHKQAMHDEFNLTLVGHGSVEILEHLNRRFKPFKGVKALGSVDSVSETLKTARMVIVPILHGSGTRLKILEAMLHRAAVVSTTLGAQGIQGQHGKHFMLADTPEDFAAAMRHLRSDSVCQRLTENASELLKDHYLLESVRKRFREVLDHCAELNSYSSAS